MTDLELPAVHPAVLASKQAADAIAHINRHPDTLVRWPFPDLDALTGPMGEGEVWFVPAFSGGGKTSFIASCIEGWRLEGKRVFVMPLELQPKRFRTMLACIETGTHPGDALSGQLRSDPNRRIELERLEKAVLAQVHEPYCNTVLVSEQRAINVMGLQRGLMEAKAFNADVVIVDHIDHISGDGKGYDSSKEVNHAALMMAQDNGLLLIFTSQLNMEIAKADALAKYRAPQVNHVQFPSVKLQVCTGMIGLYRPLRAPHPGEGPKEYAAAIKAAREGHTNAPDALEPGVMGVVTMKLRNYGSREGVRLKLGFARGRVVHLPERDRHSTTYDGLRHL